MHLDIAPYAFVGSTLVCLLVGTVIFGAVLVFAILAWRRGTEKVGAAVRAAGYRAAAVPTEDALRETIPYAPAHATLDKLRILRAWVRPDGREVIEVRRYSNSSDDDDPGFELVIQEKVPLPIADEVAIQLGPFQIPELLRAVAKDDSVNGVDPASGYRGVAASDSRLAAPLVMATLDGLPRPVPAALVSALLDLAPSLNDANTRFRSAGWSLCFRLQTLIPDVSAARKALASADLVSAAAREWREA